MRRYRTLTHEALRKALHYNPDTGIFTRRGEYQGPRRERAGTLTSQGHRTLMVEGRYYRTRILAWLYITERWPEGNLIALNGDNADDRWVNIDYQKKELRSKP